MRHKQSDAENIDALFDEFLDIGKRIRKIKSKDDISFPDLVRIGKLESRQRWIDERILAVENEYGT